MPIKKKSILTERKSVKDIYHHNLEDIFVRVMEKEPNNQYLFDQENSSLLKESLMKNSYIIFSNILPKSFKDIRIFHKNQDASLKDQTQAKESLFYLCKPDVMDDFSSQSIKSTSPELVKYFYQKKLSIFKDLLESYKVYKAYNLHDSRSEFKSLTVESFEESDKQLKMILSNRFKDDEIEHSQELTLESFKKFAQDNQYSMFSQSDIDSIDTGEITLNQSQRIFAMLYKNPYLKMMDCFLKSSDDILKFESFIARVASKDPNVSRDMIDYQKTLNLLLSGYYNAFKLKSDLVNSAENLLTVSLSSKIPGLDFSKLIDEYYFRLNCEKIVKGLVDITDLIPPHRLNPEEYQRVLSGELDISDLKPSPNFDLEEYKGKILRGEIDASELRPSWRFSTAKYQDNLLNLLLFVNDYKAINTLLELSPSLRSGLLNQDSDIFELMLNGLRSHCYDDDEKINLVSNLMMHGYLIDFDKDLSVEDSLTNFLMLKLENPSVEKIAFLSEKSKFLVNLYKYLKEFNEKIRDISCDEIDEESSVLIAVLIEIAEANQEAFTKEIDNERRLGKFEIRSNILLSHACESSFDEIAKKDLKFEESLYYYTNFMGLLKLVVDSGSYQNIYKQREKFPQFKELISLWEKELEYIPECSATKIKIKEETKKIDDQIESEKKAFAEKIFLELMSECSEDMAGSRSGKKSKSKKSLKRTDQDHPQALESSIVLTSEVKDNSTDDLVLASSSKKKKKRSKAKRTGQEVEISELTRLTEDNVEEVEILQSTSINQSTPISSDPVDQEIAKFEGDNLQLKTDNITDQENLSPIAIIDSSSSDEVINNFGNSSSSPVDDSYLEISRAVDVNQNQPEQFLTTQEIDLQKTPEHQQKITSRDISSTAKLFSSFAIKKDLDPISFAFTYSSKSFFEQICYEFNILSHSQVFSDSDYAKFVEFILKNPSSSDTNQLLNLIDNPYQTEQQKIEKLDFLFTKLKAKDKRKFLSCSKHPSQSSLLKALKSNQYQLANFLIENGMEVDKESKKLLEVYRQLPKAYPRSIILCSDTISSPIVDLKDASTQTEVKDCHDEIKNYWQEIFKSKPELADFFYHSLARQFQIRNRQFFNFINQDSIELSSLVAKYLEDLLQSLNDPRLNPQQAFENCQTLDFILSHFNQDLVDLTLNKLDGFIEELLENLTDPKLSEDQVNSQYQRLVLLLNCSNPEILNRIVSRYFITQKSDSSTQDYSGAPEYMINSMLIALVNANKPELAIDLIRRLNAREHKMFRDPHLYTLFIAELIDSNNLEFIKILLQRNLINRELLSDSLNKEISTINVSDESSLGGYYNQSGLFICPQPSPSIGQVANQNSRVDVDVNRQEVNRTDRVNAQERTFFRGSWQLRQISQIVKENSRTTSTLR